MLIATEMDSENSPYFKTNSEHMNIKSMNLMKNFIRRHHLFRDFTARADDTPQLFE